MNKVKIFILRVFVISSRVFVFRHVQIQCLSSSTIEYKLMHWQVVGQFQNDLNPTSDNLGGGSDDLRCSAGSECGNVLNDKN